MLELGKLPGPVSGYATCTTSVTAILLLQMLYNYPFSQWHSYSVFISQANIIHTSKWTENMNEINQSWIIYEKFDKFENINTKHSWM